jgi:hypothetical protein
VDLNHRPLGYEPIDSWENIQEQGTTAQKTLHLASEFSAGLGWFCTAFPHISRTPESKIIARAPTHWRFRDSLAVDCGKKVSLQAPEHRTQTFDGVLRIEGKMLHPTPGRCVAKCGSRECMERLSGEWEAGDDGLRLTFLTIA